MILVYLAGGLGNQLFEYAFSRYVAERHRTDLYVTYVRTNQIREYELHNFNIGCIQILEGWDEFLEMSNMQVGLRYIFDPGMSSKKVLEEVIALGNNLILDGEWSNYTEFLFDPEFQKLLRQELTLKAEINDDMHKHFQSLIEHEPNSVAVHVRHGDYVHFQHIFTLCGEEYYKNAFFALEQEVSNPRYFVFSDEIDWVENNLRFARPVQFVKPTSVISGFELSRRCHHIICANSTFSWWAAYLNDWHDKMVIVPAKYFENEWQAAYEKELESGWGYMPPMWLRV